MTAGVPEISRRNLIQTGAVALTAASYSRILGANDRIRLGVVGLGSRGAGDMRNFIATDQVDVVALCDIWGDRVDAAKTTAPNATGFADHRKLLEIKDMDAVLIATPDHWHAPIAIDALNAGKDIYIEKPLTLKIEEGPQVVKAVRANNRICQVGMQQRSGVHYMHARDEYIRKGKLGKITLVRTWWHGSGGTFLRKAPPQLQQLPANLDWKRFVTPVKYREYDPQQFYCFRAFLDYGGGQITDLFAHWIDVAHMAIGEDIPMAASAVGGIYHYNDGRTAPDTISVQLAYPGKWVATFEASLAPGAQGNGIEFYGTEGMLYITRGGFQFTPVDKSVPTGPRPQGATGGQRGPGFGYNVFPPPPVTTKDTITVKAEGSLDRAHMLNFIDCMRTRKRPNADVVDGHRSAQACHLGTMSYVEKRQIRFDPVREAVLA